MREPTQADDDIVDSILETSRATYRQFVENIGLSLEDVFGVSVCVDDDVMTCVVPLADREKFLEGVDEQDLEFAKMVREVDSRPAAGLLRVVIMYAADGVSGYFRVRTSIYESEGSS